MELYSAVCHINACSGNNHIYPYIIKQTQNKIEKVGNLEILSKYMINNILDQDRGRVVSPLPREKGRFPRMRNEGLLFEVAVEISCGYLTYLWNMAY